MESEQPSPLSSLYINIQQSELDSILSNRKYKAYAEALLVDVNGDTLYDGTLKHIKTRGNGTWSPNKKAFDIKFPTKQKFLNLNKSKSESKNTTKKVTNIKAYVLTVLFNASATADHYYQAEVNHDFSRRRRRRKA